jgi:Zn-finger nucleic acid-binding protein
LVSEDRLASIKNRRDHSKEQLQSELDEATRADTRKIVHCPGCSMAMEKRNVKRPNPFSIDRCDECGLIWLDGGELATLQLAYEESDQGRESNELQRRMHEMSPERRAEFERNLTELPEPPNPVLLGILDAIREAPLYGCRRGVGIRIL